MTSTSRPKPGFTPDEQHKIDAFIAKHGVTRCLDPWSPEYIAKQVQKALQEAERRSMASNAKLGFIPLKYGDRTEKERKEHYRQYRKEYYAKKATDALAS